MHTILEILNLSTDYLKQKKIPNPRRQAEELMGEILGIGRMELYLEFERPLIDEELTKCRAWLKRLGEGEPIQYIFGEVEFLKCQISVTPDVLIPRQETEILADKIIKEFSVIPLEGKILWDICCGSGCIGIALKKKYPQLKVVASDISTNALEIAKKNATMNEVEIEFFEGDLLEPFRGLKTDFIVSNPPYIAEHELSGLDRQVNAYEPKLALVGGETGLEFYQKLSSNLHSFLNKPGKVWFEIGNGQGEALKRIFLDAFWKSKSIELDWSGKERFFSLEIE